MSTIGLTPVRWITRVCTVVEVTKGATTSHVRVDIGNGQIVTSSITNEAVDDLGIKAKGNVTVVVKASDVMIAVD